LYGVKPGQTLTGKRRAVFTFLAGVAAFMGQDLSAVAWQRALEEYQAEAYGLGCMSSPTVGEAATGRRPPSVGGPGSKGITRSNSRIEDSNALGQSARSYTLRGPLYPGGPARLESDAGSETYTLRVPSYGDTAKTVEGHGPLDGAVMKPPLYRDGPAFIITSTGETYRVSPPLYPGAPRAVAK